jgi:hypothetical protein
MDNPEKPSIIGYTRKRIKTNKTKNTTQKTDEQHGYHNSDFTNKTKIQLYHENR